MEDLDRWVCSCASLSRAPPLSLSLSLSTVCYWSVPLWQLLHYCSHLFCCIPLFAQSKRGESACVCMCERERITSSAAELHAVVPVCLWVGSAGAGSLDDNSLLFPQSPPPARADADPECIHSLTPAACTPRAAGREISKQLHWRGVKNSGVSLKLKKNQRKAK